MESKTETNQKEELYDEVYFDSDQDSDQEETIGLGLPGQSKKKQGIVKNFFFFFSFYYGSHWRDNIELRTKQKVISNDEWVAKQINGK